LSFHETFSEAWQLRYGTEAPSDRPDVEAFLRHRSVRKYAPTPVPESTLAALIATAQSAATSSNLQLWSVISVQDPERRAEIARLCGDQAQVRSAPWFLAFFADHHRLRQAALAAGESPDGLDYVEFFAMALVDVALAAERMVCAAESIGLGICYIGALRNHPAEVQRLLQLPSGTFGVFGLCLGYPEQGSRAEIKPRLPQESVWFRETYPGDVGIGDYDDRMRDFYEAQKMSGEATWSQRSGRRVDGFHMSGREVLKEWIDRMGFSRR